MDRMTHRPALTLIIIPDVDWTARLILSPNTMTLTLEMIFCFLPFPIGIYFVDFVG